MDCDTCKEHHKQAEPVSYIAFESMKATLERTIRRLWILALVLIVLLFGTNAAWIYYESQWEVVETYQEVEQQIDTGVGDAVVAGIGDIHYGESETNHQNEDSEPQT
jgi:hypothetical protein